MALTDVSQLEGTADQVSGGLSAATASTTSIVAAVCIAVLLLYVYLSQVSDRPMSTFMDKMRLLRRIFVPERMQRTFGNRTGGEPLMNHRFFHTYRQVIQLSQSLMNVRIIARL